MGLCLFFLPNFPRAMFIQGVRLFQTLELIKGLGCYPKMSTIIFPQSGLSVVSMTLETVEQNKRIHNNEVFPLQCTINKVNPEIATTRFSIF